MKLKEIKEGIAGDAVKDVYRKATGRVTDKESIERNVKIDVELVISKLELALQERNSADTEFLLKVIADARKDLIDLQKWMRNRNK